MIDERVIVINVEEGWSNLPRREEFEELVSGVGARVIENLVVKREKLDPKYYIGTGKVSEIRKLIEAHQPTLVCFGNDLSPAQERNLEKELCCRVLDRTGLILDIFAQRARSFEGKLQVELAQLTHLSTRLIRGWSHLERQKGGIGLRGPGETQLETDRRLINVRIKSINKRLLQVRGRRREGSKSRKKAFLKTVAIVGYTNAGKSTLFSQLTGEKVYAADQLFATLDTTLRSICVPGESKLLLSDTVGFISDLPPELVAAFEATLEETREASLILHVVDASNFEKHEQIQEVKNILQRLQSDDVPMLEVYNKIDRLDYDCQPRIDRDSRVDITRVWMSALSGEGSELLRSAIGEFFERDKGKRRLKIGPNGGRLRALLYEWDAITSESQCRSGEWLVELSVSATRWEMFCRDKDFSLFVKEIPWDAEISAN